jgi:hypothetical protein
MWFPAIGRTLTANHPRPPVQKNPENATVVDIAGVSEDKEEEMMTAIVVTATALRTHKLKVR